MTTTQTRHAAPGIDEPTRLALYRQMVQMRGMEKRAYDLFLQNLVKGTSHLSLGQEAIAAGFGVAMRDDDYTFATYRGHAHTLARGVPMTGILAELMGRANGLMAGKGGSMHLTSVEHGMMGQRRSVRAGSGVSRAAREHVDADGGFVGGPVYGGSACVVFGDRSFGDAVFGADPPGGHEVGQDVAADCADEVDVGAGDDAGGQNELVPGGGEGGGEAGPVRIGAWDTVGGVGHRGPQCLVGGQQGPDFLLDAVRSAGPQDSAAQDRGFQLRVGGLDLSGRCGALLRRTPLRTGRAALTASGSSRP
ncbi:thiamine pyrophosphate-dependent enzyme [Streptomyces sp. NPDC005231]|uniref:thiamine pyrophosphate-dependent enzyme n=1 Tax=Streptomyces sp. NPDC005231 TaxID=3157026 RepID=UPI0033BA726B